MGKEELNINKIDIGNLFKLHHPRLVRFATILTKDKTLAEDIVQEAFILVIRKIHTLKEFEKFPFWINKIVINCANDALRKQNKYIVTEAIDFIENNIMDNSDPLSIFEKNEMTEFIINSLSSLSTLESQVFILRYFEDYSHKEIAKTLDINESTSRSIIFRGKKILEKNLKSFVESKGEIV